MSSPSTLALYERWAPGYPAGPHNPLMEVEQAAMCARLPALAGRDVLDLACGSGRFTGLARRAGARQVVALDNSPAMLARVDCSARVRADMTCLPFHAQTFDVVISGLALGHTSDLAQCVGEIARVSRAGGRLLYSDFHPEATRLGLRRSFRDADGNLHSLPPDGYPVARQRAALEEAGFTAIELHEIRAGFEFTRRFKGDEEFYGRFHGAPLVLIVSAHRALS
jgi:SAM-dependent methyltransferase